MVRSLEELPDPATFNMALRAHSSGVGVQGTQPLICVEVRFQICEVQIVVGSEQHNPGSLSFVEGPVASHGCLFIIFRVTRNNSFAACWPR